MKLTSSFLFVATGLILCATLHAQQYHDAAAFGLKGNVKECKVVDAADGSAASDDHHFSFLGFTSDGKLDRWSISYLDINRVSYLSEIDRSGGRLDGFLYDDCEDYRFHYSGGTLTGYSNSCLDYFIDIIEFTEVCTFHDDGKDSFSVKSFMVEYSSTELDSVIKKGFNSGKDIFPILAAYCDSHSLDKYQAYIKRYIIRERDSHGNYTLLYNTKSGKSFKRIITYWDDEPASAKPTQPVAKPATETAPKKAEVTKPVVSKTPGLRPATPKELIVMDLLTRPFGVLSKDSRGLSKEQIMFDLSDYGWKPVLLFEGSQLTMNETSGYDMSFLGRIPERAFAQFTKDNQLWCFTVIFKFDNMKEAERFANQLISSLNSEGIGVPDYNNHNNGHTRKFRYNNSFVYITMPDNMTSYRNKVTVHVSYRESDSWIE